MTQPGEPPPWHLDRDPLTAAGVHAILARRFPTLRGATVRSMGHGWDFDAWLADERWLFRFPRRAACVPWLARETGLLRSLAGRLPLQIPVPIWQGEPGDDFPHAFGGHAFVAGLGGDHVLPASTRLPRFARDMGRFLAALQAVRPSEVKGPPLGRSTMTVATLTEGAAAFEPALASVLPADAMACARRYLDGEVPVDEPDPGPDVLIHGDLFLEHVVFEPSTGHVAGIIDWADAGWGPALADLTPLWVWFGDPFIDALLEAQGRTMDAGEREHLRVCGVLGLLGWIGQAVHHGWVGTRLGAWAGDVFFPRLLGP